MSNEVVPTCEANVLAIYQPTYTTNTKVKQKILEEEEYLSILGKLVERDFYPELTRLKLRSAYIDALDSNDVEKLREIQIQLEKETPSISKKQTPRNFDISSENADATTDEPVKSVDDVNPKMTLNSFLFKNTSEDNASFEKIMELTRKKHREKHAWLFEKQLELEARHDEALALPITNEEHLNAIDNKPNNVDTWKYAPRNALMYTPDGVELSMEEYIDSKGKKEQQICHENTRFKKDPFDSYASQKALIQASSDKADLQKAVGKVGVDGKLEQLTKTPTVRGYTFIATPSPAPGVDESPLMTWGELDGTPMRLDATPAHGPSFKIPEPPRREQIAHSLVEKASKQHREKRRKAFAAATKSFFSPKNTPGSGNTTSERLSKLSPAAQKLVKTSSVRLQTDKSLRSSYTPSPGSIRRSPYTPFTVVTPGSRRTKTPGSDRSESSITDNLLQLPKT